MNIIKFVSDFPDELSCKQHFKLLREKEGIVCKQCGGVHHYWLKGKFQWQCSNCDFRTTLRSGTMMEHSNLPIRKWYLAMAFMSFSKKGISATELQRQLNHKRYEPIWRMMHKIRSAMGQRDSKYQLEGMIEFDEGYFVTETNIKKKKKLKRGRGSQKNEIVSVMADPVKIYLQVRDLMSLDNKGVGSIKCEKALHLHNFLFTTEGVGAIDLNISADSFIVKSETVGAIHLSGKVTYADITHQGVGVLDAFELLAQKLRLSLSGVGAAHVYASETIDIKASGVGNIIYKGHPKEKNIKSEGIGKVASAD